MYKDLEKKKATSKRYRERNKEKIKEQKRIYNAYNADKNAEYARKYREAGLDRMKVLCECGKMISRKTWYAHKRRNIHLLIVNGNQHGTNQQSQEIENTPKVYRF